MKKALITEMIRQDGSYLEGLLLEKSYDSNKNRKLLFGLPQRTQRAKRRRLCQLGHIQWSGI